MKIIMAIIRRITTMTTIRILMIDENSIQREKNKKTHIQRSKQIKYIILLKRHGSVRPNNNTGIKKFCRQKYKGKKNFAVSCFK